MESIEDFIQLSTNNFYSIHKINWWLLKYYDQFKEVHQSIYDKHWYNLSNGISVRLPPPNSKGEKFKFLNLYNSLDTISVFHKKENYFKEEWNSYLILKNSRQDLKSWLDRNEEIITEEYSCFELDYLDYSDNVENLKVYVPSLENLNIFIDREYFKHTLRVITVFYELLED